MDKMKIFHGQAVRIVFTTILTLGLSISLQSVLAAWTAPASAPPGGNVSRPILASSTVNQIISGGGGLGVVGNISANKGAFTGVDVNTGWVPAQQISINSNQIWKSMTAGDSNLYLQYSCEGCGTIIGDGAGGMNNLTVRGMVEIMNDNADNQLRFHDPSDYLYSMGIDRSDGGKFKIGNGGNIGDQNAIVIDTSGRVGIGTGAPNAPLHVMNGIRSDIFFFDTNEGNGWLYLRDSDGGAYRNMAVGDFWTSGIAYLQGSTRFASFPSCASLRTDANGWLVCGAATGATVDFSIAGTSWSISSCPGAWSAVSPQPEPVAAAKAVILNCNNSDRYYPTIYNSAQSVHYGSFYGHVRDGDQSAFSGTLITPVDANGDFSIYIPGGHCGTITCRTLSYIY